MRTHPYSRPGIEIATIISSIRGLAVIKIKEQVKTCISFLETPNIVNIITGISRNIACVNTLKSTTYRFNDGLIGYYAKKFISMFYNNAFKIVAVSHAVADDLIINFGIKPSKIKVIYNGFDLHEINRLSAEPLTSSETELFEAPTVITVGRLHADKAQWVLIRAFAQLIKKLPEARLLIVGNGPESSYLHRLTEALEIEHSIFFLGFQNNPFKFVKHSDLFVLTSPFEGFGNVLIEAMACATPVATTDCFSSREILYEQRLTNQIEDVDYAPYGVHLPKVQPNFLWTSEPPTFAEEKLTEVMLKMLRDKPLLEEYARRGLIRAQRFNIDNSLKEWLEIIQEVR